MHRLRVAMILGSVREQRFCDTVANWVVNEIAAHEQYAIDVIDPREIDTRQPVQTQSLKQRLEMADAFIVITPEYNHGYTAALKSLIDSAAHEWNAKPVAFVSYGGGSGGIRAVEQLRQVFIELHAVPIRDAVAFPNAWDQFDERGQPKDAAQARGRMSILVAGLTWWAAVLRYGREIVPYASRAALQG